MVVIASHIEKSGLLDIARTHCANWDNGNCVGCMIKNKNQTLIFRISSKFAGKSCQVKKKCKYFDNVVMPGIKNGI